MKNEIYGEDFLNKSSKSAFKQMQYEKRDFITNTKYLRSLSIQNREGFRGVYNSIKQGNTIDLQAILSPMYNNNGTLSTDKNYFNKISDGLEGRIQKKVILSTDIIKYLTNYFNLKLNFVIADKGLLLKSGLYEDKLEIDEIFNNSMNIFKNDISEKLDTDNFSISKLSDSDVDFDRIRDMSFVPTIKDCEDLIYKYAIFPDNILRGLYEIIEMYGITVAYYEIDAYFKESKYIGDNFKNNIILNIEGSSLGNKKLIKGKDNMSIPRKDGNGGNLLIGGVINKY